MALQARMAVFRNLAVAARGFSTSMARRSAAGGAVHEEGSYKKWKMMFFLGAIPAIILGHYNAFVGGEHEHRPEFVKYEHLRLRTKKFPWGDGNHSLFHNKHVNALPDGYEDDEGH